MTGIGGMSGGGMVSIALGRLQETVERTAQALAAPGDLMATVPALSTELAMARARVDVASGAARMANRSASTVLDLFA